MRDVCLHSLWRNYRSEVRTQPRQVSSIPVTFSAHITNIHAVDPIQNSVRNFIEAQLHPFVRYPFLNVDPGSTVVHIDPARRPNFLSSTRLCLGNDVRLNGEELVAVAFAAPGQQIVVCYDHSKSTRHFFQLFLNFLKQKGYVSDGIPMPIDQSS